MTDLRQKYPLLRKFLEERESEDVQEMIGPRPAHLTRFQEQSFALIDRDGVGTPAEKQAAMICAALVIEPVSMYYDITRLVMNYGVEMEYAIEPLLGARPGQALPPIVAQARAAAGAVLMENMAQSVAANDKLGATAADLLAVARQSFSQDEASFGQIEGSPLAARYLAAKENLFARLEAKIEAENPAPKKKPKGRSFDL
ncbi:MAG TPA: hypothetical protein VEF76_05185 [Patescibacteria group bacterium]|nr:hypothetical protein [Patescibacteria group bacterium]